MVICCLLALLAGLPGVSLVRRRGAGCNGRNDCGALRARGAGRDIAAAMMAAGILVGTAAAVLAMHHQGPPAADYPFGPICSAFNRVASTR